MKKLVFLILSLVILLSCGKKLEQKDVFSMSWDEIKANAKGQEVSITMWGGSKEINLYFDNFIAPNLKEKYGVNLRRVPVTDIREATNKMLVEAKAKGKAGSVDVIWLNGENFHFVKNNDLLLGDINSILPNINNVDKIALASDFGEPVEGLEAPLGQANFIMISNIKNPPTNTKALKEWLKNNKGRFTYPNSNDFVGNAFIRTIAVDILGRTDFQVEDMKPVWDYFNEIKPYLWREGKTYPESSERLSDLFSSGEVDFTMSYAPSIVENKVATGEFPKGTSAFVFDVGSFTNNHYLTIAKNTKNPEASLVFINYMLSEEAQSEKLKSSVWGDGSVLRSLQKVYFEPQLEELGPKITEDIKDEWNKNVAQKN